MDSYFNEDGTLNARQIEDNAADMKKTIEGMFFKRSQYNLEDKECPLHSGLDTSATPLPRNQVVSPKLAPLNLCPI